MTIFKQIPSEDRVSTRTLLHEAIPITGTILSGTYGTLVDGTNIKNFSHGMFQSVYDYPYLSSSANHIFDISIGTSEDSSLSVTSQPTKKDNIYNQMAQVLAGYNKDGNIQKFDEDGDLTGGTKIDNCIFVNFSRLLVKDEIKKGSFQMTLGANMEHTTPMSKLLDITDHQAATSFRVNSPAGEYGILYASSSTAGLLDPAASQKVDIAGVPYWKAGLIYYQAGIAVLSDNIFRSDFATVTIKGTNAPTATHNLTITAADGTSATFTAHGSTTNGTLFSRVGSAHGIDNLKTSIEASSIASKVTVSAVQTVTGTNGGGSADGSMITITQNTKGTTGNKAVTINAGCPAYHINSGAGGASGTFAGGSADGGLLNSTLSVPQMNSTLQDFKTMLQSSEISSSADALRHRIKNIQFNNTIELNSTVYFCRVKHNEFNYSANPTYLTGSQIRIKQDATDIPISYITSIGLYSADNQLLAVGKFSEPIRKDNNIELTFRARLDY